MRRPSADLTTTLGITLICAALSFGIVWIAFRAPTAGVLVAMLSGGGTLIGIMQRAPLPAPEPTAVQTQPGDAVATKPAEPG